MTAAETVLRRLYGPTGAELAAQLAEVAEHLHGALCALSVAPTPEACDDLARDLYGSRAHVLRLAEALRRERGE